METAYDHNRLVIRRPRSTLECGHGLEDVRRNVADVGVALRGHELVGTDARELTPDDRVAILAQGVIVFSAACRDLSPQTLAETYATAVGAFSPEGMLRS